MILHAYLPQDRLRALARGDTLPDRTVGAALFADISGFTPLTETLTQELGSRRGSEELTQQVNVVYDALIAEIEKHGGSVISFAGDAITCWFDGDNGQRAVTAALALQSTMFAFPEVGLKVVVASGAARRFVVGDADIQLLDALAGSTIARLATAEYLANKGEVLIDTTTMESLAEDISIQEWRVAENGERFGVIQAFTNLQPLLEMSVVEGEALIADAQLRPWILPAVFDREQSGQGSFLTEFRPCAVLFVCFIGIDYDSDEAQAQLDLFVCQLQNITSRYEGALLQLMIGDKGSYVHVNFGALSAHEDAARRAVKTALELKDISHLQLQMGIAQGVMRVGAYGGHSRCTYSALGDDVNLAARLMQTAPLGEIVISGQVRKAVVNQFVFEPRSPLLLKGKTEPIPTFVVVGERRQRAVRLQEPIYALPMVGRQSEFQIIEDKLDLALQGKAQVIGIVAEAGMGKSRLAAEVIRSAHRKGFAGFGGVCQSDAINTPYQAWKSVWSAFFDVDPSAPLRKQLRLLEGEIEDHAPERVNALPLLGVLLNLEIPDNDFTKPLEPKYRQSTLHALLENCLRAAAKDEPILIVIEDLHWIDALSHNLLEELVSALNDSSICFVLAYRPPQLTRLQTPRLEALPNFTKVELSELSATEAEQAIRTKLAQLYPARSGAVPVALVKKLMTRAQGNPFYLEELLNFLHDRGLDPRDPQALEKIELPDNLHTLILSRIDQLSERERTTLRVASIVGRLFRAAWLTGYYPELGQLPTVKIDLDQLAKMEITPLDTPEPELAYLFKHIVTHEVTYESLPFATRARLHEQLAGYLEGQIAAGVLRESSLLDALVFHYARTENHAKQREYLHKAGQAALKVSAFTSAIEYLTRLMELLLVDDPEHSKLALQLAEAHYSLGDYPAARVATQQAQSVAMTDTDRASALAFLGEMASWLGDYAEAQTILSEAVPLARASGDPLALCRALYALGDVNWRLEKLDEARTILNESLALARTLGDEARELFALNRLGTVALQQDLAESERLFKEVLSRALTVGNRERAMTALNNLGSVAAERQDYVVAREYQQQTLTLAREIGAQEAIAMCLINQGNGDIQLGQLAAARAGLREGLALALRLGVMPWAASAVTYFALLKYAEGQTDQALALWGMTRAHPAWSSWHQHDLNETLAQWNLDPAAVEAGLAKGAELDWDVTIQELLKECR